MNAIDARFAQERPVGRRICGDVLINSDGWLGVCVLHPSHRHPAGGQTEHLPSPYLGLDIP